jgi:NADH-quinone oxidoreductase subunit A
MYLLISSYIIEEFINFILFGSVSTILTIVIFSFAIILKPQVPDGEKLSTYECGFQPFSATRLPFTISYYLIALLFIIFDIELVSCLPLLFIINTVITVIIFTTIIIILFLSIIGLYYEWKVGSIEFILT